MAAGSDHDFAEVTKNYYRKIQNVDSRSSPNVFIPQK